MFGFSLTKILLTVAVVAAVWYGYKWIGRVQKNREVEARARVDEERARSRRHGVDNAQDMVECDVCAEFVAPAVAGSCGNPDCPYPL